MITRQRVLYSWRKYSGFKKRGWCNADARNHQPCLPLLRIWTAETGWEVRCSWKVFLRIFYPPMLSGQALAAPSKANCQWLWQLDCTGTRQHPFLIRVKELECLRSCPCFDPLSERHSQRLDDENKYLLCMLIGQDHSDLLNFKPRSPATRCPRECS